VIEVPLAYAFTVGLVSVVNPCGFPMLPAYLSWFISEDELGAASRVPRAVGSALTVSAGFLAVFAGLGVPINAGVSTIYRVAPWLTIVIGVAMALLGVAMLAGTSLKLPVPRLDRGGGSRRPGSMFVFGMSYAVTSLGCTMPLFLIVVAGTARRENLLSGLVAFAAYGIGFAALLTALAVTLALARDSLVRHLRALLRVADRVAAVLLIVVGTYLVYYGIYALDTDAAGSAPVGIVDDWSSRASSWLQNGGARLGILFGGIVFAGLVWARARTRTPSS
jgi:cytochrome c-type biogenesis protein